MGWDFCEAWRSREDVRDELIRTFSAGGNTVLAHGFTRERGQTCLWIATTYPSYPGRPGGRLLVCALVEKDKSGTFGFKEMSEDMGPCFYSVPANVWDQVKDHEPPTHGAKEWRSKVKVAA